MDRGTWPPTWESLCENQPEIVRDLEVKWKTESIPNLAVVARDDIGEDVVQRFTKALFALDRTEAGRPLLKRMHVSHFEVASSATYRPARDLIAEYRHLFGELPALPVGRK